MATIKTSTLTFRIEPVLKEALRSSAEREHRSIANMVEVMIRDYCGRAGIAVPIREEISRPKAGPKSRSQATGGASQPNRGKRG